METSQDLVDLLKDADLKLEAEEGLRVWGRLASGVSLPLRSALRWVLGRYDGRELFLEGGRVCLVDRGEALARWRKKLDGK